MCDIIQYLSFLFHLAEYPPSPSLLLQRTSLRSFLWLSSIPLCTYVPYLLYPFSTWGLRPFPCLACCESGCSEHGVQYRTGILIPLPLHVYGGFILHVNAFPTPREQLDKIHLGWLLYTSHLKVTFIN